MYRKHIMSYENEIVHVNLMSAQVQKINGELEAKCLLEHTNTTPYPNYIA